MYLSDGGIVVVVSDGGVVIICGGLGQLHRFGRRTQLMHAPRVSDGGAHSSHYLMKTLSLHSETYRLQATCLFVVAS